MKFSSLFLLFSLLPFLLAAQWMENFDDGDFSNQPTWLGDTAFFKVKNTKLNSNLFVKDHYFQYNYSLSTPSNSLAGTVWKFWVKTKTTSGNNFIRIFLTSQKKIPRRDTADYAYFIEIGDTPDWVVLCKKDSLKSTHLIESREDITDGAELKVKVVCTKKHEWQLFIDPSGSGNHYKLAGTSVDSSFQKSKYFSIEIFQRGKTANESHWFDDISIRTYVPDTLAPQLTKAIAKDNHHLYLHFSEALSSDSLKKYQFHILQKTPDSAYFLNGNTSTLSLYFSDPFQTKVTYPIAVHGLEDIAGNHLDTATHFIYYVPKKQDVVISEIYPDPSDSHGLPDIEFLEIYNKSNYPISLEGWKICDQVGCAVFPPISIHGDSTLLLTDSGDEQKLISFGKTIGLSHFPSLNNGGDKLYLKNNEDDTIYQMQYTKDSYQDKNKDDGGWTLELKYPNYPCIVNNWSASNASIGGTPGTILRDNTPIPAIKINSFTVKDASHLDLKINILLEDSVLHKIKCSINEENIPRIKLDSSRHDILHLELNHSLQKSKFYTFKIQQMAYCGLEIGVQNKITFALPEQPTKGDIFINELLFNASNETEEFIELYNASNKMIDLHQLYLANKRHGDFYQIYPATNQTYYFLPKQYVAITKDKEGLILHYFPKYPKHIIETDRVPSYPNKAGNAFLLDSARKILDQMSYTADNQSTFFHSQDGVSLEKTFPTLPSKDIQNWVSASSIYHYATPGYRNSQFQAEEKSNHFFKIKPETFTPDGDGIDDLTYLSYHLSPGYAAKIIIFNEYGIPVKHLKSDITLGTKGKIPWNGKDDNGQLLPTGIYIFFIQIYHPSGKTQVEKIPVVLAMR